MSVLDIATTDVVTVEPETPVPDIARIMRDERVGSVVVVDDKDVIAGIVTDRDIVTYGFTRDRNPRKLIANDLLAKNVFSVDPDASVGEVCRRMSEEGVRRVPLVRDGKLVGIVTLDDLVVHLAAELESLASVIEGEFPV